MDLKWQKTCVLSPSDVSPSRDDFEVVGTFNAGAVRRGEHVELLVRVAEQPIQQDDGWVAIPRYGADSILHVDRMRADDVDATDPRVIVDRRGNHAYLTSVSYLRHYRVRCDSIDDRSAYRYTGHRILPAAATEAYGIEDPRITYLNGQYWITYVSVSVHGACTSLCRTDDFETFDRLGVIAPNENKDVVLLPERIGEHDRIAMFHRPVSATPFGPPEMWYADSDDGIRFGNHRPLAFELHEPMGRAIDADWSSGRVGAGTVPIRVRTSDEGMDGWLHLFHGNRRETTGIGRYCGALMLCDAEQPWRVTRMSPPVIGPDAVFENEGFVPGVVFPTAWVDIADRVAIFYGSADTHTAVATVSRSQLLGVLNP